MEQLRREMGAAKTGAAAVEAAACIAPLCQEKQQVHRQRQKNPDNIAQN